MHYRLQSGDGIGNEFCLVIRPATRTLSSETSATAMARFSLDLRDLEAASALGALGVVPETQLPSTKAIMHELSTDSEVTFRKVLGSAEILPTRPGVDPFEVTRCMPDLSGTSQSPVTASPSVIARSQSGSVSPAASYVFGPQLNIGQRQTNIRQTPHPYNTLEHIIHTSTLVTVFSVRVGEHNFIVLTYLLTLGTLRRVEAT